MSFDRASPVFILLCNNINLQSRIRIRRWLQFQMTRDRELLHFDNKAIIGEK